MKISRIVAVAVFAAGLTAAAFGQAETIRAQIDFPFTVEGKVLPAGTYDFVRDDAANVFRVTDGGRNEAAAQVQTRLADLTPGGEGRALVVFDKIGDRFILSEIWIPGEDGFAVTITKAKHEHRVVKAK